MFFLICSYLPENKTDLAGNCFGEWATRKGYGGPFSPYTLPQAIFRANPSHPLSLYLLYVSLLSRMVNAPNHLPKRSR
jgi:hypothetical protein